MSPSSSPEVEGHPSSRPILPTMATTEACSPLKAKSIPRPMKSWVAPVSILVSLSATQVRSCSFIQYISIDNVFSKVSVMFYLLSSEFRKFDPSSES
uniref:Uncharacterized protein n=1 Tax=Triticum urartu TaxID=4572 RepID=A0A8R7QR22_TRIUA